MSRPSKIRPSKRRPVSPTKRAMARLLGKKGSSGGKSGGGGGGSGTDYSSLAGDASFE